MSTVPARRVAVNVPVRRVAVIGAGPAGAITIDALAQEGTFDVIRVFERRERPGGCWYVLVFSQASAYTTDLYLKHLHLDYEEKNSRVWHDTYFTALILC